MNTKEIKITVPEGYEIDKENSTFECIKFKKKGRTYLNVHKALFGDGNYYYISVGGNIVRGENSSVGEFSHLAKHSSQLEQILALNKLMNVAKYLNAGWKPDWSISIRKWYIYYNHDVKSLMVECNQVHQHSFVYFQSKELAKQAIEILGEEEVKLALGV
jgi:hypothetical protein